jgi:hypothetical protein
LLRPDSSLQMLPSNMKNAPDRRKICSARNLE